MINKYELLLRSNKKVIFRIRSFHYLNFDLRQTFNTNYPTIAVLYRRDKVNKMRFKRITVEVIENPQEFFNKEPISDNLRNTVIVLLLDEILPSPKEKALKYLNKLQHEIIEALEPSLQFGFVQDAN